jgi:hypothetical protein
VINCNIKNNPINTLRIIKLLNLPFSDTFRKRIQIIVNATHDHSIKTIPPFNPRHHCISSDPNAHAPSYRLSQMSMAIATTINRYTHHRDIATFFTFMLKFPFEITYIRFSLSLRRQMAGKA